MLTHWAALHCTGMYCIDLDGLQLSVAVHTQSNTDCTAVAVELHSLSNRGSPGLWLNLVAQLECQRRGVACPPWIFVRAASLDARNSRTALMG
jgi:hypothetical protein